MFVIVPERKKDLIYRENLLDKVFGLDRHNLTTYKLRIDVDPVSDLSFSALYNDTFQGSLRFWPVLIKGAYKPLLLGPLAVDPVRRGQAIGVALVRNGLFKA
ncbi:N-acetyltransferase, partial [Alphaproteobacteria bacterium]|nr:N-acetyltransferase [Alphaproteobacteria bacterium]